MRYIFVAGAPGSRWSGVAKSIYSSNRIDKSDSDLSYTKPGESVPMHVGSYWDPGMTHGKWFDRLPDLGKAQAEFFFDEPFKENNNLIRIIKSHQFCKHLEYIKTTWPLCPIVVVYYVSDDATEQWWYEAGGFDITYPDYSWYKDRMREEIEIQNAGVLEFIANNKTTRVGNSDELGKVLGIDTNEFVDFAKKGAYAYVYMPHLIDYFGKSWQGELQKYEYSGLALLNKIPQDAEILDVGCGKNFFKQHFTNLTGIDPANEHADYLVGIEEFVTDKQYDALLCLGSLNFGSVETVYSQCKRAVELTKSGGTIYWRCNPGLHDHKHAGMEDVDFFAWSFELHEEWARQLNCDLLQCVWDTDDRIYAEWRKQ